MAIGIKADFIIGDLRVEFIAAAFKVRHDGRSLKKDSGV